MNDTLVAVHCYAGDRHQVEGNLPAYLHHGSKVVIVSPTDSRVTIDHPGVDNLHAGLVGYTGQISLDRQLAQMKALLASYPDHKFFLLNDADSAVLDPTIPQYLYDDDVVWSNQVLDDVPNREPFPDGWPHVAFQPPYFLSRNMMEKMVAVGETRHPGTLATHSRPFIDFYMVQLTMVGGLPWRCMRNAISWPISINKLQYPRPNPGQRAVYANGLKQAERKIQNEGVNIVHSVKDGDTMRHLIELRRMLRENQPGWTPSRVIAPAVKLPTTTLVIVATRGHVLSKIALDDILGKANFRDVLIFTDQPDRVAIPGARYFAVPDWDNKKAAGQFYYAAAAKHVETDFGLFMEWDAGIYDPSKWQDAFLAYDYIGAPWNTRDELKVGNGGFTIMSQRLSHFLCDHHDRFPVCTDWELCRTQRPALEEQRFKWAPFALAHDFSWELVNPRSPNTFGYHGIFNWPEMIGRDETIRRATLMLDDEYLRGKMLPLFKKHPWVAEAIDPSKWEQESNPHRGTVFNPRYHHQRQHLLLLARRQEAANKNAGMKA